MLGGDVSSRCWEGLWLNAAAVGVVEEKHYVGRETMAWAGTSSMRCLDLPDR